MPMPAANDRLALPKTLYFETTNRCNLRCKGCILYRGNWEQDRDVSLQDIMMITAQLPELERAVLHGIGEPLLNKALPEMIRHLKERGVFVLFNSNGTLLNKKWQKDLIDAGLDELRISLDAASPQGYHAIRNSDTFDQIVRNLKSFVKFQKKHDAAVPKLSLWYLGTKDNITELPAFVHLAAEIGIEEVYLQRLVYFQDGDGYGVARAEKTLHDAVDGSMQWIQKSQELAAELGVRFNASGLCGPVNSLKGGAGAGMPWRKCQRPLTLMYITANGNVLPCCISPFSTTDYASIILGNVFEASVAEIWTGTEYHNFRKKHQTESAPKCCRGCGVLWSL
jgi:radical SAM protein with 4Fe4S-binding SPASM domain